MRSKLGVLLFVLGAFVLIAWASGAAGKEESTELVRLDAAEGVSSLDYAPKPFHSTRKAIRVRCTTVGRARPGRKYAAWIFTGLGNAGCYLEVPYVGRPIRGARGRTYIISIRANAIDSDGAFCKGRARLQVSTELVE